MREVEPQTVVDHLNWSKEICFQVCDERTRKTGRLTKVLTVIDLRDMSLWTIDRGFYSCVGESSKHSEKHYPTLLGANIVINHPAFLSVLFNIFSFVLPKSAMDKVRFCKGRPRARGEHEDDKDLPEEENISNCPFASLFLKAEDTADFLGGKDDSFDPIKGMLSLRESIGSEDKADAK